MNDLLTAAPESGALCLPDARERQGEILVVGERNDAAQRPHALRSARTCILECLGRRCTAGRTEIGYTADAQWPRLEQRQRVFADIASDAHAGAIFRGDVEAASGQAFAFNTIAEHHARGPGIVDPNLIDQIVWDCVVKSVALQPGGTVDPS